MATARILTLPGEKRKIGETVSILGIDPGYGRLGWGAIEIQGGRLTHMQSGIIETSKDQPLPSRLKTLYGELKALIQCLKPEEAAVEELFFSKNVKTAIDVGQARGVAVLACAQAGLRVSEYKPCEIKLAVTGCGSAPKDQVAKMICVLLGLKAAPRFDDTADALATAICHAHSRKLKYGVERKSS